MNKGFFKFLIKLVILVALIWGIFAVIALKLGMYIYDEEYASYKQTLDYVNNNNDYNDVLIFGDSVAKAGIIPEEISDTTYNISMAGATTIEQYYIMEDYLQNHKAPKTLIMMYFIGAHDSIDDFFWNRTLYFNCLKSNQLKEIVANGSFSNEEKFNMLQYKLCTPNKYYAAIKNAMLENRYEINEKEYKIATDSKGQHYFGTEESFAPDNVSITGKKHFEPLEIIDKYMKMCIEQCEENGIQVIIEQHPINASTFANMNSDYKKEYMDYMKKLQEEYPNIIVDTEYNVCDNDWLGDFSHLNKNGATKFSQELSNKYAEYLK